jgi:putative flippase GtrA
VNLGLLWACTSVLGWNAHVGWAIAVECSLLSNFTWNRTFTWQDRRATGARAVIGEAARYHLACAAGIGTNFAVFSVAGLAGVPTVLAGLFGIAAGMAMNFAGCMRFVFRAQAAPTRDETSADSVRAVAHDDLRPAEAAAEWGRA